MSREKEVENCLVELKEIGIKLLNLQKMFDKVLLELKYNYENLDN